MIFTFRRVGNWEKFSELTKTLSPDLFKGGMKGQKKVAELFLHIVRDHLSNQDLSWKPLNPKYAASKRDNSDLILIERYKYFRAIEIVERENYWAVGVRKNRYYQGKGFRIPIWKVAIFHENGNNNLFGRGIKLPSRPLWAPSARELNKKEINSIVVKEIRAHLLKRGWKGITLANLRKFQAPV